jgi:hypothetical protein
METETNKYHKELSDKKLPLTAEELLHIMRPEVEEILQRHGWTEPPSQSHRAIQAITEWENPLGKDMTVLLDFLKVHRTVWILEGKPI